MALTSTIQTGDGAYDLSISAVPGVDQLPDRRITLLQEVVTRWGDSGDGWGDPILPSTTTVTLYDPSEAIVDLIAGYGRRELLLQITGPDSYDWRGWYTAEPIERPFLDSRQGERPTYDLLFYDGLVDIKTTQVRPLVAPDLFQAIADLLPYNTELPVRTDMEWNTKFSGTLTGGDIYDTTDETNSLALGGFLDPNAEPDEALVQVPIGGYLSRKVESLQDAVQAFCKATDTRLCVWPTIGSAAFTPRQRVGESGTYTSYYTEVDTSGIFPTRDSKSESVAIPQRQRMISGAEIVDVEYRPIPDAGLAEVTFPTEHSLLTDDFDVSGGRAFGNQGGVDWTRVRLEADDDTNDPDQFPDQWARKTDYFDTTAKVVLDVDIDEITPISPAPELILTLEWVDRSGTTQFSASETYDLTSADLPIQARVGLDVTGQGRVVVKWVLSTVVGQQVAAQCKQTVRLGTLESTSGSLGQVRVIDTFIVSDTEDITAPSGVSRGDAIGVDPEPYLHDFVPLVSDNTFSATPGPTEAYRDTYWNVEGKNPHLFRGRQRAAAQSAAVQTLRATALGVYPPEYSIQVDGKPGVKYVPGEGRKISLKPGRAQTTLYDLELPTTPPS